MATPGELVEVTAAVLGIPRATVTLYDRVLAENGLRSKSGRGRSAPKVNSRDAAHLLIAVVASPISGASTKDAAIACKSYSSLPTLNTASAQERFPMYGLPSLAGLPKKHCLIDALTTLIDKVAAGERFRIPSGYRRKRPSSIPEAHFSIRFQGPRPWAEILAELTQFEDGIARLVYVDRGSIPKDRGDLVNEAVMGFGTIYALGCLVKELGIGDDVASGRRRVHSGRKV